MTVGVLHMKFWFCELCGTRLTEDDLANKDARDKKLRGVYCKSCAVGVTTMDTMPMSNAEAREMTQREAEPQGKGGSPRRTSGGSALPPKARRRRSSARIQPPGGKPSSPVGGSRGLPMALGAGAVVLVLVIAVLALTSSNGEVARSGSTSNPRTTKTDKPGQRNAVRDSRAPPANVAKEAPVPQLPIGTASVRPESIGTPSASNTQPMPPNPTPQTDSPANKQTERTTPEPGTEGSAATRKNTQKQDERRTEEARARQEKEKLLRARLDKQLERVRKTLEEGDLDAALAAGKTIADDREMADLREAGQHLQVAVQWMKKDFEARKKALDSLVGQTVALKLSGWRKAKSVHIESIKDGVISGSHTFQINNVAKKRAVRFAIGELPASTWEKVLPRGNPDSEPERLARILKHWSMKDVERMKTELSAAEVSVLALYLSRAAERLEASNLEEDARKKWAAAETLFNEKKWEKAGEAYRALQVDFAQAEFVKGRADELARRRLAIRETLNPYRLGLAASYYADRGFQKKVATRVLLQLNMAPQNMGTPSPEVPQINAGLRWRGYLKVAERGGYAFKIKGWGKGRVRLNDYWVDGGKGEWKNTGLRADYSDWKPIALKPGHYPLLIEYLPDRYDHIRFEWKRPSQEAFEVVPRGQLLHDAKALPPIPKLKALRPGLKLQYYSRKGSYYFCNQSWAGRELERAVVPNISMKSREVTPGGKKFGAARWSGYLRIPRTGTYTLSLAASFQGHLVLDRALLLRVHDDPKNSDVNTGATEIKLDAGLHPIQVYLAVKWGACGLHWAMKGATEKQIIPAAYFFHLPDDTAKSDEKK